MDLIKRHMGHDHSSMGHDHGSMSHDHGSMDMSGMDMSSGMCSMEMSWNWKVIDSCFLTDKWHVRTRGQFAGTCIGIFLWVMILVGLRRLRSNFDDFIVRNRVRRMERTGAPASTRCVVNGEPIYGKTGENVDGISVDSADSAHRGDQSRQQGQRDATTGGFFGGLFARYNGTNDDSPAGGAAWLANSFRPTLLEQLVRALIFGFEYGASWLLGLILMSFNGYVIISAFLGAAFGFFFFEWERLSQFSGNATPEAPKSCC